MQPHERVRLGDGAVIKNFEVQIEEEEEEKQEVVYAGGIKGIRALRQMQRE